MDRMIYTAMTGAKHILEQQTTVSNNLANVSTTGFRAQLDTFRAVPVKSEGGLPTRTFVVDNTVGTDFRPGAIQQTGRALDVAVQGDGWFVVQRADGSEGYTRNGSFKLNENGLLQTQDGLNVMGDGGPITIPPDSTVTIANDGTISTNSTLTTPSVSIVLDRFRLVNPPQDQLARADDGLFTLKDGTQADGDANVRIIGGALENSNVNAVDSMVNMIALARQFELNINLLKNAESNADKANQLLSLS
jgi:flagellar basal-body rod protein FlgF